MKKLIIASKNMGKIDEIKFIFSDMPLKILSLSDIGLDVDIVEDGNDFWANSLKKARVISKLTGELSLADDSGLEVDALNGQPGVNSARYAGEEATDQENNIKLLKALTGIESKKRTAHFRCVITLYTPYDCLVQTLGSCYGKIAFEPRGKNGFGYDPIFITDKYNRTMAELSKEEKSTISHRKQAILSLKNFLTSKEAILGD